VLPSDGVFRLPAAPPPPARPGFPLVASVAPLAVSALIFVVTGSAFVLVFAVLGPVIAVATVLDGRRAARRTERRDRESARRAHGVLRDRVAAHLDQLSAAARDTAPGAAAILRGDAHHRRWEPRPPEGPMPVALGAGSLPSGIRLDGGDGGSGDGRNADHRAREEELRCFAAQLTDVPLVADLHGGVAVVGPLPLGRAVARGLLVQAAHLHPPGRVAFRAPAHPDWAWLGRLPHAAARSSEMLVTVCEPGHRHEASCRLALAEDPGQVPAGCASVLQLSGLDAATIIRAPGHVPGARARPELVSVADAARFAAALSTTARAAGLTGDARDLPRRVAAGALWGPGGTLAGTGATTTLACPIGVDAEGPVIVDLVADGPHAVVGGTTGSGKSELLATWVTAMAALYPPGQVTFLLVDFKGGAAFQPLLRLPHCVGLVTDLDETQAARALASLRAEIRHRERVLHEVGARDVADPRAAGLLPRLVIVVDEFQAMLAAFEELHVLFVDLAARGRSLGIHLILCTQRPAGVVRDALLANCSLRLSLRVNNRADSVAVIGVPDAAGLGAAAPGRCLLARGDGLRLCQVAVTEEEDIARAARRSARASAPRRPWREPLPTFVTASHVAAFGALNGRGPDSRVLGLLDEPEEQRHGIAIYRPGAHGNLLVIGGAGSGKTGLVATLAAQSRGADWVVPATAEGSWDALADAAALLEAPATGAGGEAHPLLLLDDFDAVYGRWAPEYQAAAVDRLTMVLRQGSDAGFGVVITAQRVAAPLGQLAALCPALLLLRLPSREAHRAAGGDPAQYDPALPPGGGRWQGSRLQLLEPPGQRREAPEALGEAQRALGEAEPIPTGRPVLVVSGVPSRTASELRARRGDAAVVELGPGRAGHLELQELGAGTALVGDPDAWQSNLGLLAALRTRTALVFDRCTLGDYRLLSRRRDLPPVLAPSRGRLWLLTPAGDVKRAVWDEAHGRWPVG
jgi:S-DNA-T family DNA segregation ATPase FtsK/SpoIIIE